MLNTSDSSCSGLAEPPPQHDFICNASPHEPLDWEAIVNQYSRLIEYWCLTYGVPRSDLENFRQEVFIRLAGSIDRFEPRFGKASFQAFLKTITRNLVYSAYRKADPCTESASIPIEVLSSLPQNRRPDGPAKLTAETAALHDEVCRLLNDNFSKQHVFIFTEYVVHQRKPADIADQLDISTNTIYQVRSRIMNFLRIQLGDRLAV